MPDLTNIYQRVNPIKGWFSNAQMDVLYPYVQSLPKDALLLELGTYRGKSTLFFRLANPDIKIITIDLFEPYEGSMKPQPDGTRKSNNVQEIDPTVLAEGNIFSIKGDNKEVVKGLNMEVDFLFIDSDHSYPNVKADIENYTPFVKEGCIVAFHDYDPGHPDVPKAIDEWMVNNREFKQIEIRQHLYIARRIAK